MIQLMIFSHYAVHSKKVPESCVINVFRYVKIRMSKFYIIFTIFINMIKMSNNDSQSDICVYGKPKKKNFKMFDNTIVYKNIKELL